MKGARIGEKTIAIYFSKDVNHLSISSFCSALFIKDAQLRRKAPKTMCQSAASNTLLFPSLGTIATSCLAGLSYTSN